MKNNFLYTLMSILLIPMLLGSCLESENGTIEYSTDTSIRAFSIDTIYGKKYRFSIDLLNNEIFNADSLPYLSDTLLKSFKIDTFLVTGYVTVDDTIVRVPGYANLQKAVNGTDSIMFTVYAADYQTSRNYRLDVRVHQQDPDSLTWSQRTDLPDDFANADLESGQKAVTFNNQLFIYHFNQSNVLEAYHTPLDNPLHYSWQTSLTNGLPANVKLQSIQAYAGKLYLPDEEGALFYSNDGLTWTQSEELSGSVKTLLAGMKEKLLSIRTINGTDYFCLTEGNDNYWQQGRKVPQDFPTERIYATSFTTRTGVEKATIIGISQSNDSIATPWFTIEGDDWAALNTDTLYCPVAENPVLFHYNNKFYAFGSGIDSLYTSVSGLTWTKVEKKFLLPEQLSGKTNFSMTVDKDNYIWIVVNERRNNQLWRGRQNLLGFKRQ